MEKKNSLSHQHCLNCGAIVNGQYCQNCGQHVRDNSDRSLGRLFSEFFSNIFFLDNRFFISIYFLLRYPGRMTVEYLEGKRKKFIPTISLFLFINLIYFLVNPITDYSLSLYDQTHAQPYSSWVENMVNEKLQKEAIDEQTYSLTYQNTSDQISKSIMIINVPLIALIIYLISFRKRPFYFDSLIYAFHFFSLFLLSCVLFDWINGIVALFLITDTSIISGIVFYLFVVIIPLVYGIISIQNFNSLKWYWALPSGVMVIVSLIFASIFYRFIIFQITFWAT